MVRNTRINESGFVRVRIRKQHPCDDHPCCVAISSVKGVSATSKIGDGESGKGEVVECRTDKMALSKGLLRVG